MYSIYKEALWNWQRNSKFNRASRAGKQRDREGNEHTTVRGSRSLRGLVHHRETTGASDTKENSPAIRGVQRNEVSRILSALYKDN